MAKVSSTSAVYIPAKRGAYNALANPRGAVRKPSAFSLSGKGWSKLGSLHCCLLVLIFGLDTSASSNMDRVKHRR